MSDHVTASEAAYEFGVSVAVICMWRHRGWKNPQTGESEKLTVVGYRGRSPLYARGQLMVAERDTGRSPKCRRKRMAIA